MTAKKPFPPLLTPEVVSEILHVSEGTLMGWRSTGRYDLPFVKVGRLVRYRENDVLDFIESRRRTQTEGV